MQHNKILNALQNFTQRTITQTEIANALGYIPQVINKRAKRNSKYSDAEIDKLVFAFGNFLGKNETQIKQNVDTLGKPIGCTGDCRTCKNARILAQQVEIKYIEELPESDRLPEITSLHADLELIVNHWQRNPDNLRIIPMQGDNLTFYFYPCKNRDVLIVDIGSKVPTREGIYVYQTMSSLLFVAKLAMTSDGTIIVSRFEQNGESSTEELTLEKQKEIDFRILGRLVKNASLSL